MELGYSCGHGAANVQRFLFRIDVSPFAGTGHLRRCLTLAQELADRGGENYFLCRAEGFDVSEYMIPVIKEWKSMEWATDPERDAEEVVRMHSANTIDTAIIDHYRADEEYQKVLYASGIRWLQFDGAGRFPIWADWVLNMSPGAAKGFYDNLVRKSGIQLLGPEYAILRDEFTGGRWKRHSAGDVRRIILIFGGGDDRGAALFCLDAIKSLDDAIERVVLMSSLNPQKEAVLEWCNHNGRNTRVLIDERETAPHMAAADLGITSGGTVVFEMAALGVPLLMLQIADNQIPICKAWENRGYGVNLGSLDGLSEESVLSETTSLMMDAPRRKAMSEKGMALVDGRGARRVAETLLAS